MLINKITKKNANIPPDIEQFAEKFTRLKLVSLVNLQSKYNQLKLNKGLKDLTEFQTPLRLIRNCTVIQKETNSVAQFCRVITYILKDLILNICRVFVNNIRVKGPKTDYGGKEALLKIRRFILKCIINLNKVLTNIEYAEEYISSEKS